MVKNTFIEGEIRYCEEIKNIRKKCKHCGWLTTIWRINEGKRICKNCGKWVFVDDKEEFKYRTKEMMNKCKYSN